MAFIRPYQPSDWDATAHICRATLPPTLSGSAAATRLAPYIWTHPFAVLRPQHCFVLDDGGGTAVGYVIGCADVQAMADDYGRYVAVVSGLAVEGDTMDEATRARARVDVGPPPADLEHAAPSLVPGTAEVNAEALRQLVFSARWLLLDSTASAAASAAKRAMVDKSREGFSATLHINVLPPWQGAGWGRQLVHALVASVRAQGARGLHIGVSGENTKVVPFYERLGFRVHAGGEAEGNVWMVRDIE